jgi:hypothetical protein
VQHHALAADRAGLEVLLGSEEQVRDLGFGRLGARMAAWAMLAALEPVPGLAAARTPTGRPLREPAITAAHLASVSALRR